MRRTRQRQQEREGEGKDHSTSHHIDARTDTPLLVLCLHLFVRVSPLPVHFSSPHPFLLSSALICGIVAQISDSSSVTCWRNLVFTKRNGAHQRLRVCLQSARVFQTHGRFEGTHGNVLNPHTYKSRCVVVFILLCTLNTRTHNTRRTHYSTQLVIVVAVVSRMFCCCRLVVVSFSCAAAMVVVVTTS